MYNAEYVTFSATINVTYTEGATCTCTLGDKVLTAPDTTGFCAFTVGATGTWTVKIEKEDEPEPKTTTVEITENGQTESVEITFIPIVPWSTGSDEDIAAMLQAHYEGKINIWDYWEIGQERVVHLNAISGGGIGENQTEQDVIFVLMHKGGFQLTAGGTCAAVVGQKDCLGKRGIIDPNNSTNWRDCFRRTWCNGGYRDAFPETIKGLFKQFEATTGIDANGNTVVTDDYFALPAEKEIFGSTHYANATAEANLFQFEWYETVSNQIKHARNQATMYWERSLHAISGAYGFCYVTTTGKWAYHNASEARDISPFGVI